MPSQTINEYQIEYEGVHLHEHEGWGAYVTVYGPSRNPMHRNSLYPTHHVSADKIFSTQQEAEAEAYRVAQELVKAHRTPPPV